MFGMPRLPPEDRHHWEIGEGGDRGMVIEKSWKELVPEHKVGLEHRVCPHSVMDTYIPFPSALEEGKAWRSGVMWGKHLEMSCSRFQSQLYHLLVRLWSRQETSEPQLPYL